MCRRAHRSWRKHISLELFHHVSWSEELGDNVRHPVLPVLVDSAPETEADVGRSSPHVLREVASRRGEGWIFVVVQRAFLLRREEGATVSRWYGRDVR